jgi:hypothetical protein
VAWWNAKDNRSGETAGEVTVAGRSARLRWIIVLTCAAVLCAVPVAVRVWPVGTPAVSAETLAARIRASAGHPFQGYALSTGSMGLPELPRLGRVTALFSGTTQMRSWYAGPDRWRVDVVDTGTELGLYQTPEGQYTWDYGANQLTQLIGAQPVRLPRAADLMPPDLARRLLAAAVGDRVTALPGQRVAGIAAAGLRITPSDRHTTVGSVDIWADPATGLPLQVEITGRGSRRPVLVTRFLEVSLTPPADAVLTPPAPRPGVGFTATGTPDLVSALGRWLVLPLPAQVAGQPRREPVTGLSTVAAYGTGLAQFTVVPLPRRIGAEAYDNAQHWGTPLDVPGGAGVLISTSLLSVAVVRSASGRRTYLLAGLVDGQLLGQAGAELAGVQP